MFACCHEWVVQAIKITHKEAGEGGEEGVGKVQGGGGVCDDDAKTSVGTWDDIFNPIPSLLYTLCICR